MARGAHIRILAFFDDPRAACLRLCQRDDELNWVGLGGAVLDARVH